MLNIMTALQRNKKIGPLGGSVYLSKQVLAEDVHVPEGYNGFVPVNLDVPSNVSLTVATGSDLYIADE